MRLWSLHPKYLDVKGLVALWREALLAKAVLEGRTKGYKFHPQLERFKKARDPLGAINRFLKYVYDESKERGYNFDVNKIGNHSGTVQIPVNAGQCGYEAGHLKKKLKKRLSRGAAAIRRKKRIEPNALFKVRGGPVEEWEIVRARKTIKRAGK